MTPTPTQFADAKAACGDAILLFRLGDFCEAFDADASLVSRCLGLTLMRKGERLLAGFPYHQLESYLAKLVEAGHRVAVCEQVGDYVSPARRQPVAVTKPQRQGGLF